jgi:hypothetical protein
MTAPTITSIINPNPVPLDERPIAEMPFEGGAVTKALLIRCGVVFAHQIEALGCTGATKFGLTLDEIRALRLGLAGGGVGLPCFVDSAHYCLAHNTIGGLQHEQLARYSEFVGVISRPLTKGEAGHVAFTEAVRHSAKASDGVGDRISAAGGMLSGYGEMPRGTEMIEEEDEYPLHRDALARSACTCTPKLANCPTCTTGAFGSTSLPVQSPFTCPEHAALVWTCRFCVASAVANGELEPVFTVHQPEGAEKLGDATFGVVGSELVETIEKLDAAGASEIEIYVLAKTMKRRLG